MARIGRNAPCPCGSGNRFRKCCGSLRAPGPATAGSKTGIPVALTHAESVESLEHAVRAGDRSAAARLGLRYLVARGVPSDPARGMALIEQAAQAGDAEGASLAATIAGASFWRAPDWDRALKHLTIAADQGHEASQNSLRILAGGPSGSSTPGENWPRMCASIDLSAWFSPPTIRTIREAPHIRVIEGFVPPALCDWLVARAQSRLARATIYDKATGGAVEDDRRLNSECDLDFETCGLLTFILRGRIAAITGRPDPAMEVPKVLHYAPGETFAEHFDYLDPAEPAYARELATRGQRSETFLVYLNDDYTGGETCFPRISLSHKGAKGDALLFSNVDSHGQPDGDTMHAGLPPVSGSKWLFSQWIRNLPTA